MQQVSDNEDEVETEVIDSESETSSSEEELIPKARWRTDTTPDHGLSGPATDPEPTPSVDPQPDPQSENASKKTSTEEPDLYDFNFDFESTPSQPGSSSGVRVEAGSSSGVENTEHDEVVFCYATKKRQVFEQSDSDNDEDAYVTRLKRRVVQNAALKEAQVSSLQSQISSRDLTIDQLQGDVGMLMSTVYDLKTKLEKKFGNEFVEKEDEQFFVGRTEKLLNREQQQMQ
ncbi:hypothetical protein Hanom_Chr12g01129611 [Helianthus anomalus]